MMIHSIVTHKAYNSDFVANGLIFISCKTKKFIASYPKKSRRTFSAHKFVVCYKTLDSGSHLRSFGRLTSSPYQFSSFLCTLSMRSPAQVKMFLRPMKKKNLVCQSYIIILFTLQNRSTGRVSSFDNSSSRWAHTSSRSRTSTIFSAIGTFS